MFQFSGFASTTYGFSHRYLPHGRWVSPFGNLRFSVCLPTYRSLSQATTSFIAFYRLGIHHMRLVPWSYNLKRSHTFGHFKQPVAYLLEVLSILAKEYSVQLQSDC